MCLKHAFKSFVSQIGILMDLLVKFEKKKFYRSPMKICEGNQLIEYHL